MSTDDIISIVNVTLVGRVIIFRDERSENEEGDFCRIGGQERSRFRQREGYASEFCLSIQIAFPAYE